MLNPIRAVRGFLEKAAQSRYLTSFLWPGPEGMGRVFPLDYGKCYRMVPTVRACVDRIAADASGVALKVYRASGGELVETAPTDPVARFFATANPRQAAVALWRQHYARLMTWGDSYLLTDFMGKGTPQEMWVLQSGDKMRVVTDTKGQVVGYRYRPGPVAVTYEDREIYHARLVPDEMENDLYGTSPLASLAMAATLEYATLKHWTSVMQNGGFVAGVIMTKGIVPPELKRQIKQEWHDTYAGPNKAGKVAFFDGESEYKPIGLTPKDADFVEQWKQLREAILSVYGVPPALVGILRSGGLSDANVKEQTLLYWQNTVLPLLSQTEADLNEIVLPRFGQGYVVKYDLESVPALQEMLLDRATKLFTLTGAPVLTRNEAREQLKLPPVVGGDQLFAPLTVQPFGAVRPVASYALPSKGFDDTPERASLRAKALERFEDFERPAAAEWRKHFNEQEARILASLKDAQKGRKDFNFEDIFDEETESELVRGLVQRIMARIVAARGQGAIEDVDPTAEFFLSDPAVEAFLEENALNESKLIVGRQREEMRALVVAANKEGIGLQELAGRIREQFAIERSRAQTIARTESARAYNFATHEAWEQSGMVSAQEWLSAGDEAVRDAHLEADGQVVPIGQPFDVGGERLEYPGDPSGSAENTINCRCSALPVVEARSYRVRSGVIPARNGGGRNYRLTGSQR